MSAPAPAPAVAVVGFGELGEALCRALPSPRACGRTQSSELDARIRAAGAVPVATLEAALDGAGLVLACVPGTAARALADRAASRLAPGAIFADLSSAGPEDKAAAAERVASGGGRYADAAVLGAVAASGARVPILASGEGAAAFAAVAGSLGLVVSAIDGPAGAAARVKLLRSVYMKGRDALVAEMLLGASHHGLEEVVAQSIRGPGEEVPFPALAERILGSLAAHASRRADELAAAAALLRASGVEPAAAEGAERRLRLVADAPDATSQSGGEP